MTDWDAAREFVRREGRVLDRRVFAALFEDAGSEGVVAALAGYRNPDGGFGHGLEPDTVTPHSQPLDVQVALELLATVGAPAAVAREVALPACDFLAGVGEAVPILLPTIAGYPLASHWIGSDRFPPDLNPTAGIAAALHRLGVEHPWREAATEWCLATLEKDGPPAEAHALRCVFSLLDAAPDRARAEALVGPAADALPSSSLFRADPDDPAYGVPPTDFAPSPDSRWGSLFDETDLAAHVGRLEREQQDDGGWPVTWEPPGEASRLAWRAVKTIEALRVLRAYGR
jgi:hypothetical protein